MVACRKNGTKLQWNGGSLPGQRNDRIGGFNNNIAFEAAGRLERDRADLSNGPAKENKRNLSPLRALDRAQVKSLIQKIGKDALK